MPQWNWFAFDAQSVAMAMLQPVQDAVRKRDLVSWQKIHDQLSQTHTRPHVSRYYGMPIRYATNSYTIITARDPGLSRDEIPEQASFSLRRALQVFVEHVSQPRIGRCFPAAAALDFP